MDFNPKEGWVLPAALEEEYFTPDGVNPFDFNEGSGLARLHVSDKRLLPHDLVKNWSQYVSQDELDCIESKICPQESESESDRQKSLT